MMTCNSYDKITDFFNENPDDLYLMTNVPLSDYTSFKIGGRVDLFCDIYSYEGLREIVKICSQEQIDLKILGFGTNILAEDKDIHSVVIRLSGEPFNSIKELGDGKLSVGSRVSLKKLIILSARWGLSGIEWLSAIPASLGGAIASNAGAFGNSMGNILREVTVITPDGSLKKYKQDDLSFSYRTNPFSNGEIITEAIIQLTPSDKSTVSKKIKDIEHQRKNRFPKGKNAGCVFKNPDNLSAGELIDQSGLKGKRVNGATVSNKHANFIINDADATSSDVLNLIEFIQDEVEKTTGVRLELEIKIWS